jgi:hypothetical protein
VVRVRRILILVAGLFAVLTFTSPASSTPYRATGCGTCSVYGYTNDGAGQPWGGATVRIRNQSTNAVGITTSGSDGYYQFTNLAYLSPYALRAYKVVGCYQYDSQVYQWTEGTNGLLQINPNLRYQITRIC